ncbi:10499_t:CDS:2, partial [Cetraspora pellucida]
DIAGLIDEYFEKKEKLEDKKKQVDADQKEIEQQIDELKTETADQIKEKAKGEEIREFIELAQTAFEGLLQKTVGAHLEFIRAKKQNLSNLKEYRKQFNKLYSELTDKLSEEQAQEVESILNGYEELAKEKNRLLQIMASDTSEKKPTTKFLQTAIIVKPISTALASRSKQSEKQNLSEQLLDKKKEREESLTKLKNELKEKLGDELGFLLEMLLEIQVDIIEKGNDPFIEKRFTPSSQNPSEISFVLTNPQH